MCRLGKVLGIAAVYVGAVVGAGFASGREIVNFFTVHGSVSRSAIIWATVLFAVVGYATALSCRWLGADSYQDLYARISSPQAGRWFSRAVTLFLFLGLTIMVSGSATLISELWSLPLWVSSLVTVLLLLVILSRGLAGVQQASGLLVLVMVGFVLYLFGRVSPSFSQTTLVSGSSGLSLFSALLYVSFNSIVISVVITSLSRGVTYNQLVLGILLGALVLGVLLYCCNELLLHHLHEVQDDEMPLLQVVVRVSPALYGVYLVNLWAAFITTALANTLGLLQRLQPSGYRILKTTGLLITTVPLASLGFSRLVATVYPVLGYLALPFVAATIWQFARR